MPAPKPRRVYSVSKTATDLFEQCIALTPCLLVPAVGIEPTTNGLQSATVPRRQFVNQQLATLANLEINVVQSHFRHSQSELVTNAITAGVTLLMLILLSG